MCSFQFWVKISIGAKKEFCQGSQQGVKLTLSETKLLRTNGYELKHHLSNLLLAVYFGFANFKLVILVILLTQNVSPPCYIINIM